MDVTFRLGFGTRVLKLTEDGWIFFRVNYAHDCYVCSLEFGTVLVQMK